MAYRALYRKYRPRLFSDIVGQNALVKALANQVETGRISHAYLFSGPRGTGKTSAAKVLARAINCENSNHGEACGKCRPCVELLSDTNMDIAEIDAASNNSVDKVREMIENVKYMPAVGRFRVYIVDEVHMLSTSAFNALLKTLEEPPAHVVFILATTEPHKLPATVLSRCQQFQFHRISVEDMTALLEGVLIKEGATAEKEALQAVARASEGGMRDALSLMDQCLSLDETRVTKARVLEMLGTSDSSCFFSVADCLLSNDPGGAVGLLDGFIKAGGEVRTFAADLSRHMRDLFIAAYVRDPSALLDASQEEAAQLSVQSKKYAPGDILKCLGELSGLEGSLRYAANPRVLAELALFRCCRQEKQNSYEDLAARLERLEARIAQGIPAQSAPQPARPAHSMMPAEKPTIYVKIAEPVEKSAVAVDKAAPARVAEPESAQEAPPWDLPEDIPLPEPPGEEIIEALPGQMDLFAGVAQEPPQATTQPSMRQETKSAAAQAQPAAKLWRAALKNLEKAPQLYAFASKGGAAEFDGDALAISFTEDDRKAADMLADATRMARLRSAVEEAAGRAMEVRLKVTAWSPAQQQFIDRSRAVIPKDTIIEIEKKD